MECATSFFMFHIFVKNGYADKEIPEVSVESILQHSSCIKDFQKFEAIKNFEFLEG
jgi:hypothetical protein